MHGLHGHGLGGKDFVGVTTSIAISSYTVWEDRFLSTNTQEKCMMICVQKNNCLLCTSLRTILIDGLFFGVSEKERKNSPTLPLSFHNSKALMAGFSKKPEIFLLNFANELNAVSISGPSHLRVNKMRYCDSQMSL